MNDIGGILKKFIFESPPGEWAIKQLRELLIGALQQGPVPQHVAFEMDGNRRYARSHRMETVEGHHRGFEALARVRPSQTNVGRTYADPPRLWRSATRPV